MASPNLDDLIAKNNKYISKIGKQINPQINTINETEKEISPQINDLNEVEKKINLAEINNNFEEKEISSDKKIKNKEEKQITNLIHDIVRNTLGTVWNTQARNLLFLPKVDFTVNPKRESIQKEIVNNVPKVTTYNIDGYNLKLETDSDYLIKIGEKEPVTQLNSNIADEKLLEKNNNDIKPSIDNNNNIKNQNKETGKNNTDKSIDAKIEANTIEKQSEDIKPSIDNNNNIKNQNKETGKNNTDKNIQAEAAKDVTNKKEIGIDEEIKKSINDPSFIKYDDIVENKKEFNKLNEVKEPNNDTKLTTYNNSASYTKNDKDKNFNKIDPDLINSIQKLKSELDKKDKTKRSSSDLEKEASDKFGKVKAPGINDKVFSDENGELSYSKKLEAANKLDQSLKNEIDKAPKEINYKYGTETVSFNSLKKEDSSNKKNLYDVKETEKQYENLRKSRPGELGFLYVRPVTVNNSYLPTKIPFEFNPKITESGLQARYNAVSFLSRIGDVQNFVGVSPLTLNFSTEYEILSDGNAKEGYRDYWVDYFTEKTIEEIEMAYRSLVMPNFIEENSKITYIKPPVIKILFGDYERIESNDSLKLEYNKGQYEYSYPNDKNGVYNNNLILASQKDAGMRFHKMFVATNVTIIKDEEKRIIYTKDGIHKYSGFSVDMTLIEVAENYMDILPDYKVYYESFKDFKMPSNPGYKK